MQRFYLTFKNHFSFAARYLKAIEPLECHAIFEYSLQYLDIGHRNAQPAFIVSENSA